MTVTNMILAIFAYLVACALNRWVQRYEQWIVICRGRAMHDKAVDMDKKT